MNPVDAARANAGPNLIGPVSRAFLMRCLGAVASLGYGLLLADVLAPAAMGEFAIAVSVAMIAATVAKFGLDAHLMWRAAGRPWAARDLTTRCTTLAGLAGAAFSIACVFVGLELRPAMAWTFAAFQFAVPFLAMNFVLTGLLKAGNLPAAAVLLETGGWQAALCACAIAMHYLGLDSLTVVAVCFAAAAALLFAGFRAAAAFFVFRPNPTAAPSPTPSGTPVREVAPLAAVSIGQVLMRWSDTLWLAWWLEPQAVAAYAVCTRLAGGITFAGHAVNAVAAPRFAVHHERGHARQLATEFRRACAVSAACAALAAAVLAALAPHVLGWLGPPYDGAAGVLLAAAGLMAVQVALAPVGTLAAMSGRAVHHLKATGVLLALQQVAYALLIPRFGMAAALVGFALPQALASLLTLTMLRRGSGAGGPPAARAP